MVSCVELKQKLIMNIEQFLQTEGIEPNHVIYNMMNIKTPKVDLIQLLKNFEKQLSIHGVVSTCCDCEVKGSFDTEILYRCRNCNKEMI